MKTDTATLSAYFNGGYHYCTVRRTATGTLIYVMHEGGSASRWRHAIRQINAGATPASYVSSAGDCFEVKITH